MSRPPRILLSAGEASGDRLGAGLAEALRARRPDIELLGMGGEDMAAAGVRLVQDASEVAVVGFVEVLSHLGQIRRAMTRLEQVLDREQPDLLVPIDFPDFNLRLAARARRRDVDVVYFVSPQVWAWRRGRVHGIRNLVRRMLVLFPFEVPFYEDAGVPVTFVGHPVVERVAAGERRPDLLVRAGLNPERPVVALLPGSRTREAAYMLPPLTMAARILQEERPELQFLVSRASTLNREPLEDYIRKSGLDDIRIHAGDFPAVLTACAAGAVASGTATLEAAMAELPMVIAYRVAPLSYAIAGSLVRIDNVGLPNLVAGRRVVPELIQSECVGPRIAGEIDRYLSDPGAVRDVRAGLRQVRDRLGGDGAYDRAADAILDEIKPVVS